MHEVTGFTGCGHCHSKDENLMSAGRDREGIKKDFSKRFREDQACVPCHDSTGAVNRDTAAGRGNMGISGTFYCPKDKLRFSAGTNCPECGGTLINVTEAMERSRANPSNGLCMECHPIQEARKIHNFAGFPVNRLAGCLDCHKGHDDCGSCHH